MSRPSEDMPLASARQRTQDETPDASRAAHTRTDLLRRLEEAVRVPRGRLQHLLAGDDWTCVMGLQALLEATLGSRLASGEAGVARLAAKLPLGGAAASKLGVADALELADDRSLRFVRQLAELRMRLVADLSALNEDLRAEVAALPPARRRWLVDGYWSPLGEPDFASPHWRERCFLEQPRLVLLLGTCAAAARLLDATPGVGGTRGALEVVDAVARELLVEPKATQAD